MPETTVLVLIDGEVSAGNPLLDALSLLKPKPRVREFSPKRTGELAGWLNQRAATLGIRLEARAVPALAGLVGNNLRLLDSELRKLGTFAGDRAVTAEDVNSLVSLAREANVFAMVDAAAEGRTKDALAEYHRLLRAGEAPQRFLAMIARQFRLMLQARDLLERGVPQREVQARLRLPNFVAQRVIQQTSGYSTEHLRQAYRLLIDADMSIKRGVYDDETAVELLLHELGTLRPKSRASQQAPRGRPGYSTPRAAPPRSR
jgi:DNA polymerase-3 subunit delta